MTTQQLIDEATSLPVEDRARLVDSLLRSLNAPRDDMDAAWAAVAQRRLDELRSGKAKGIPAEDVFAKIRQRFGA